MHDFFIKVFRNLIRKFKTGFGIFVIKPYGTLCIHRLCNLFLQTLRVLFYLSLFQQLPPAVSIHDTFFYHYLTISFFHIDSGKHSVSILHPLPDGCPSCYIDRVLLVPFHPVSEVFSYSTPYTG